MEHAEAREALEVAALEPGGLDRLAAGDTADAAALVSHLAGCPECGAELDRLARASSVIRRVLVATPPPDLRERTLAHVAAVGRPRDAAAGAVAPIPSGDVVPPRPRPAAPHVAERPRADRPDRRRVGAWVASIAAAVVLAVAGTTAFLAADRDGAVREQTAQIAALGKLTTWSVRIDGEADARRVALADEAGAPAGTLLFSPGTTELVVFSEALTPAPSGMEYQCWVEVDGQRRAIGKMFFGGSLAFWVGEADEIAGLEAGSFGVSLGIAGGGVPTADPVLTGSLAG